MSLLAIERASLRDWRQNLPLARDQAISDENLLSSVLRVALHAGQQLRLARLFPERLAINHKADGSPVTAIDIRIEESLHQALQAAFPSMRFASEEGGGELTTGLVAAIDPIDSTHQFLSHESNAALSIAIFLRDRVMIALVLNPATGEITYAQGDNRTRLLQLGLLGEQAASRGLPSSAAGCDGRPPLVNVQPTRGFDGHYQRLAEARQAGSIGHLSSSGGSPAFQLALAARGHRLYVHPWSGACACPHDLAAGVKLVRNAGGEVLDLKGKGIDPLGHIGPFIASASVQSAEAIARLLADERSPGRRMTEMSL
jgi:fructose-1,6-bisphosphatase/inositol monophosphatase family enzyme